MRVSTLQSFESNRMAMINSSALMNKAMGEMNVKVSQAKDAPADIAQITMLKKSIAENDQYSKNIDAIGLRLGEGETHLKRFDDALSKYVEIMDRAANGTTNSDDLKAFSEEINQLLYEVATTANSRAANGEYIFGGAVTDQAPFDLVYDTGGRIIGATYVGDANQQQMVTGTGTSVGTTWDGSAVFSDGAGNSLLDHMMATRDRLATGINLDETELAQYKADADAFNENALVSVNRLALDQASVSRQSAQFNAFDEMYRGQLSSLQDADLVEVSLKIKQFEQLQLANMGVVQTGINMTNQFLQMF